MVLQHKNSADSQSNCIIAFGSNKSNDFGVSVEIINEALRALSRKGLFKVEISGFYQTPAFPVGAGPDFVNGVLRAQTELSPCELLSVLHEVEAEFGRTRNARWEARTLDLDLIDFDGLVLPDETVHEEWRVMSLADQMTRTPDQLILPHPRVQDRPFVLVPMRDVAPDWTHPVTGESLAQLLSGFSSNQLAEIRPIGPTP